MGFREGQSHYSNTNLVGDRANMVITVMERVSRVKSFLKVG